MLEVRGLMFEHETRIPAGRAGGFALPAKTAEIRISKVGWRKLALCNSKTDMCFLLRLEFFSAFVFMGLANF
jgi:hypothetical protein